jgi:hypothetical protein
MSLVMVFYAEEAMDDLWKKIRHTYFTSIIANKRILDFFHSPEFEVMLLTVANDDIESFKIIING